MTQRVKRASSGVLLAFALVLGLLSGSSPAASAATTPSVVRWAEPVQAAPNFIFPFMTLDNFSVANINTFQYLMYRPLYWFGSGGTPNLNPSLSLASPPRYSSSSKTVTIDLKAAKWSNGETVTSRDVMFWMNMLHAEKGWWAAYSPGTMPDNVRSVAAPSSSQVVFTLSAPVNPSWFTYDQLSQITPLPVAWDIASLGAPPGSGGCSRAAYGSTDTQCDAVFSLLSRQSGFNPAVPTMPNLALGTYATNPLWQVVDGPWRLSSFDTLGNIEFTANPAYSGPVKPTVHKFIEVPFSSQADEVASLANGSVDVGYLPLGDVTSRTTNPYVPSKNNSDLGAYNLRPMYAWEINYFPYNFNSSGAYGTVGKIFHQLYFRQALQSLVNQPRYISDIFKGFGVPTYGPTPSSPPSRATASLSKANPYPYNVTKAKSLLSSHGWKVVPNGISTCQSPGTGPHRCGPGIPRNAQLTFNLEYAPEVALMDQLMNAEVASWAQAGIKITLTTASSNVVLSDAVPCSASESCGWELANWGVGWLFEPSAYPTGESIFLSGAGSNSGSYSDRTNDANIAATVTTRATLASYARYLSRQLPVVYQPSQATSLTEIKKTLRGVMPQNPLFSITPEGWRF